MHLRNLKKTFIIIPVLFLFLIITGYSQTDTTVKEIDSEIDTGKISKKLELVRKI